MAKAEDYLDNLLNSVQNVRDDVNEAERQAEENRKERAEQRNRIQPQDDFMEASGLEDYQPEPTKRPHLKQMLSEDDFLRSFEEELELDAIGADDFIADFEKEIELEEQEEFGIEDEEPADSEENTDILEMPDEISGEDSDFLENIEQIVNEAKEQIELGDLNEQDSQVLEDSIEDEADAETSDELSDESNVEDSEPEELLEENLVETSDEPEMIGEAGEDLLKNFAKLEEENEKALLEESSSENSTPEESLVEEPSLEEPLSEEPMLSEDSDDVDLMNLLGGDDDLDEIGSLLQADDEDISLPEAEAEFESQAEDVAEASDDLMAGFLEAESSEDADGDKKTGGLKGLIAKIKSLFSKSDEEETEEVLDITQSEEEDLSSENMEILKNLEKAEEAEAKKKAKKEKKEAKKKEKKEKPKKEKKPKEPKPKKEKKPKEPDNSPKIPTKVIMIFLVLAASIVVLIFIGQNALGTNTTLKNAKSSYENENFIEAYEYLIGMELSEDDAVLARKARLLADLQKRSMEYEQFMRLEKYELALDALITGVSHYNTYKDEATELQISDRYNVYGEQLAQLLTDQFGISVEEAIEIAKLNRENYSLRINQIVEEAQLQ